MLPMVLENNVFFHHDPSKASQPVPATLVHLADIITNSLGIGTSGERFVPPLDNEAWDNLGLSPTCFDIVVKQATHQFFALESILEYPNVKVYDGAFNEWQSDENNLVIL